MVQTTSIPILRDGLVVIADINGGLKKKMNKKEELEAEYAAMFDRFHQPSEKEEERLDEILAEYMDIIRKEFVK